MTTKTLAPSRNFLLWDINMRYHGITPAINAEDAMFRAKQEGIIAPVVQSVASFATQHHFYTPANGIAHKPLQVFADRQSPWNVYHGN